MRGIAHRYWGNRLMNREHYAFAVSDFTRALELDASHTQALYDRGLLYWRELSDSRQAERDLTRVLREEPERTEAWFTRGMVRVTLDNTTGAIADFERYLEEGEDAMWREISERQVALLRTPGAGGEEME
jgi:regulator of sirC expression with transglutaminase-like and TPR domain